MEETLEEALSRLFVGITRDIPTEQEEDGEALTINTLTRLIKEAFDRAQKASQAGEWAQYGQELRELERLILELEERTKE